MWDIDDLTFSSDTFSGQVRLFPLPNLVMFPNVMQPLHVFEPRYVEMVKNALAGDRLIATCLLLPGWESDYEGRPELAPVACLGKIASYQKQEDGTYNILLLGQRRIRLLKELPPEHLYREALVEVLSDECISDEDQAAADIRLQLQETFQKLLPDLPVESEPLGELLCNQVPLGLLADIVTYTLDLTVSDKQELLAECCPLSRAKSLLEHLRRGQEAKADHARPVQEFPPKFSLN